MRSTLKKLVRLIGLPLTVLALLPAASCVAAPATQPPLATIRLYSQGKYHDEYKVYEGTGCLSVNGKPARGVKAGLFVRYEYDSRGAFNKVGIINRTRGGAFVLYAVRTSSAALSTEGTLCDGKRTYGPGDR